MSILYLFPEILLKNININLHIITIKYKEIFQH